MEDYLEALLKVFENAGQAIENTEKKEKHKKPQKQDQFDEQLIDQLKAMIKANSDKTESFIKSIQLGNIKRVRGISNIFFSFLDIIYDKEITVRMKGLIDNIKEYRESNWKTIIKGVTAAKSKKQVQEYIKQEQLDKQKGDKWRDQQRKNSAYNRDRYVERKSISTCNTHRVSRISELVDYDTFIDSEDEQCEYVEKKVEPVMTLPDTIKDLQKYFKEKQSDIDKDSFYAYMDSHKCTNIETLLTAFFVVFAERKKDIIDMIKEYPVYLFNEKKISQTSFITALNEANNKLYLLFSDLPLLFPNLFHIIVSIYDLGFDLLCKLQWEQDEDELDDIEEWQYYTNTFLKQFEKHVKSQERVDDFKGTIKQITDIIRI